MFAPEGHQWGRTAPWQRCAATRQGQRSRESAAEWWNREVKQKGGLKGIFLRNPFWRQKQKKREETFLYLSRNDINAHTKKERERDILCSVDSQAYTAKTKQKKAHRANRKGKRSHRPLNRHLKKKRSVKWTDWGRKSESRSLHQSLRKAESGNRWKPSWDSSCHSGIYWQEVRTCKKKLRTKRKSHTLIGKQGKRREAGFKA